MLKNILIVEDNEDNLNLLIRKLKRQGFQLFSAENGEVAIELLKKNHENFELIIMDLKMPVMDGWAATEFIRNTLKLDIPIIALSAHIDVPNSIKLRKSGFDDLCGKPVDYSILTRKMNALFQKNKAS